MRRVTVFDEQGLPVRTATTTARQTVCCFQDGSALVRINPLPRVDPRGGYRDLVAWGLARPGSRPGEEAHLLELDGDDGTIGVRTRGLFGSTAFFAPPFGRAAQLALASDHLVYGSQDRYELRVYSRDGTLRRVVRSNVAPQPVTDSLLRATRAEFTRGLEALEDSDRRRAYERAWDGASLRDTLPAHGRILVEEDGTTWVETYASGYSGGSRWWTRFDPEGRIGGSLRIPDGVRVVAFSRGYLLTRRARDDLGFVLLDVHAIPAAEITD